MQNFSYYKYGPTPDNPSPHWYPFLFNGTTGAIFFSDRIELHFVDGQRGDDDLQPNGQIVDVGAPGFTQHPWQNPLLPCDVNDDGLVTALDVLLQITDLNTGGTRSLPTVPAVANRLPSYLDASGDNSLAPSDVLLVIDYINTHSAGSGEGESVAHAALSPVPEGLRSYDVALRVAIPVVPVPSAGPAPSGSQPGTTRYQMLAPVPSVDGANGFAVVGATANERDPVDGRATRISAPGDLHRDLAGLDAILSAIAEDVYRGWKPDSNAHEMTSAFAVSPLTPAQG